MNKKILHTHPSQNMAKIFVSPLIRKESSHGFVSQLYIIKWNSILLLISKIRNYHPDIFIAHNTTSSTIPLLIARIMGIKKIIYYNHGVPYIGHKGIVKYILMFIEFLNCRLSHYIFTVSKDMEKILSNKTSKEIFKSGPGSVCGIDLDMIKLLNTFDIREHYAIDRNTKLICFVGRPRFRKGFKLVLQLWNKYFLKDSNYVLILCGPTKKDLEDFGYKSGANILAMGFTDKVFSVLKSADMMLLPSFHEGLSYAVLEAISSECPVIASKIPGITSLITNHSNGILFDLNKSHNDLLKTMYDLILFVNNNQVKIKKYTRNGLKKAMLFDRKLILNHHLDNVKKISST